MTDEQGALIEPCAVAAYGVARGGVRPGDSVLIAGAGPIGALAALCTAAAGAGAIYVTETNAQRRAQAERLGLGEVLDPTRRMWQRRSVNVPTASAWTSPSSAQVMAPPSTPASTRFDATGRSFRSASTSRRCEVDPMLWALNDLTIVGSWCYGVNDWPRIASQISTGRLAGRADHHRPALHRPGDVGVRAAHRCRRRRHEGPRATATVSNAIETKENR